LVDYAILDYQVELAAHGKGIAGGGEQVLGIF
jgi:hypothetical protein